MSQPIALVIEDDFDASFIFSKALETLGFNTEIIDSGEQAIERLKEVVPEIIVLDLHLPEISGLTILQAIRQDERLAATKVIVASADPRSVEIIRELANIVLIKPTTYSQVRDFAKRLTTKKQDVVTNSPNVPPQVMH